MKFGVHFQIPCGPGQLAANRYRDTIDQAVFAETLGYESVWPVEQALAPARAMPDLRRGLSKLAFSGSAVHAMGLK